MSRLGIGIGVNLGQIPAAAPLLDQLGLSAAAAWSLRKLRRDYSGAAIRVRRTSDNAEQDIGFDGAGNLDTSALLSFIGASSGKVRTWYDQSGNNRHAEQSDALYQASIVTSGALSATIGGKPGIKQVSNFEVYPFTVITAPGTQASYSQVFAQNVIGGTFLDTRVGSWSAYPYTDGNAFEAFYCSPRRSISSYGSAIDTARVISTVNNNGVINCYRDGVQTLTNSSGTFANPSSMRLLSEYGKSTGAEAVMFFTALSASQRQLLERNQGSYYGVSVA